MTDTPSRVPAPDQPSAAPAPDQRGTGLAAAPAEAELTPVTLGFLMAAASMARAGARWH